ncbi:MAG TPA: hypothetical protein DDZ53_07230, partial [Firmicutes bacterium]|nr:hypothetical protein [Bacillota bacterium]
MFRLVRRLLLLCFAALFFTLAPTVPVIAGNFGADGQVDYNPAYMPYPVLNRETYGNEQFLKQVVGTNNNSVYNVTPWFKKLPSSTGSKSMPEYLSSGTCFLHESNSSTYLMFYDHSLPDGLVPAVNKGDVQVCLMAALTNDKHKNLVQHPKTLTAYPSVSVGPHHNPQLIDYNTSQYENDITVNVGRHEFKSIDNPRLLFRAKANVCTCGSSKVSNIAMMLADVQGPSVNSIYTTRLDGGIMQPCTEFRAGDDLYINLKFNENIRFADEQSIQDSLPKLTFRVKRITDCDEETGIHAEASLVSLNKDTLTFKYAVPAEYTLGGQQVPANYYIFAVESYSEQDSWVRSTKEFSLQLPGFGANAKYPDVVLSEKLNMSTSIIVDLAGNPIDVRSSKTTLDQPAYMDNVAPTVGQVDIVRTHDANPVVGASPEDGRARSELFTGIGDQLGFFVHFNEEMALLQQSDGSCLRPTNTSRDTASGELRYNLRQPFAGVQLELLAELNIGDSAETPLRAVAQYMTTIKDGSNGPLVSKVYFALDEPIGADLEPIMYGGEPQPIAINRILLTDKSIYALADTRGNLYDETTQLVNTEESIQVLPKQQLWLDNVPPTASTTVT